MTYRSCHLITGITNGFQLTDLTQHHAGFLLGIIREVLVAYLFKIVSNLDFHIVGNVLIVLDAGILTFKLFFIALIDKCARHTKHAMHALGIVYNLFLRLQHSYLRCLHHATADKMQCGGLSCFSVVFGYQLAHQAFYLWYQADEQSGIEHIKASVKHGQHHRNTFCLPCYSRIVTHEGTHHIYKWIEHHQHPDDTKHIEQQMSQCRPSCFGTSTQRCQVGCCRSTDILAHHQGNTHVDGQHTRRAKQDGDGHHRCR